jgi:hypothetical protein
MGTNQKSIKVNDCDREARGLRNDERDGKSWGGAEKEML